MGGIKYVNCTYDTWQVELVIRNQRVRMSLTVAATYTWAGHRPENDKEIRQRQRGG